MESSATNTATTHDAPHAENQEVDESHIRFDYLTKLFSKTHRGALTDYLMGNLKGPVLVEFDPTSACNFSCPECISADLLNKERIPSERIENLMYEFARAGVRGIVLIGGGEPLAHNCMPRPIRLAYELGIQVGLTTNGSLIDRHLDALAECVSWTRVSVDAGSSETFLKYRPNKIKDSFKKVIGNMESLAKKKTGALGYSFLVIQRGIGSMAETNAHEIYQAAKLAKEIGCDYFEFKPMVDHHHFLLPFGKKLRELIAEQQQLCMELRAPGFDVIAPRSIGHLHERGENPTQEKSYKKCPSMELRTLVTPSGIYPCPYMRGREDKALGTVYDGPFDEYWNSEVRKLAMLKTDPTVDCNFYCIRHRSNVILNSLEDAHKEGIPLIDHIHSKDVKDVFF